MVTDMPADPLSRYPTIDTSRMDEFEHQLRTIYGATGFVVAEPSTLKVRGSFVALQDIALGFGACGTEASIHFGETDFARLQMPIRGAGLTRSGRQSTAIGAGGVCVTSPGQSSVLDYGADFEQMFVRVSAKALGRKLEVLLDGPVCRNVEFALADFAGPAMLSGLKRMVEFLVAQLDEVHSALASQALWEMEQAVIVQLLFAGRHNFSRLLETDARDPASSEVRRVEAYIEANLDRPIVVDTLVRIAGVSARSLYNGFEKAHGCPPMAFVKRLRLHHARDLLIKPNETTTVTAVALACGFLSAGHFANDYRSAFRELPSDTLRKGRLARRSIS